MGKVCPVLMQLDRSVLLNKPNTAGERMEPLRAPLVLETMARERLRRAVSDSTLDKLILKEAARGNF